DMIPELFPADFGGFATHHAKREFVARSELVLCVSETTRRDLVRIYGVPAGKVRVTHLGVSARFRPDAVRPAWLPEEYLLFVGHRQAYKNFLTLLDAFTSVARRHPRLRLLCVGGTPFDPAETAAIERTGLADRVIRRVVADAELPGVYAGARVFVFPSRYEGFGLPILEAFRSGCPALLADTACFREVAGDAALFFPGADPEALAAALDRVLGDGTLRAAVVRHGHLRSTSFSWSLTARRTADAYRELR
ncbi:MAG TPA: glycosyltransferase family 1 protein, partial [Catenuloplanes sp.]